MNEQLESNPDPNTEILAPLFFGSFIVLGTMIMLNLFIGVILKSMEQAEIQDERAERAKHLAATGNTTILDDVRSLDDSLDSLKLQLQVLLARLEEERAQRGSRPEVPADPPNAADGDSGRLTAS